MSAADAAWLQMDRPTNRMVIVSVLVLEAPLALDRLRGLIARRLVARHPRFGRRVAGGGPLGGPRWEDDPDFDLALHVHRVALPAPGDDAALQELVGDLAGAALDPDRPLWDVHLVEGVGDGCALVVRLHHCIADGMALARVLLELTDGGRPSQPAPGPSRSTVTTLALAPLSVARGLLRLGREAPADTIALAQLLASPADDASPLKGHHGAAQRVAWTPPLPLRDVKAIAHATGTTVNDVLLAALAGALASDVDGPGDAAPHALHAVVPFDVRPHDRPLPADLGNRFGLVFVRLPLERRDPLERLAGVHDAMEAIKRSRQPAVSYAVLRAMGLTPARVEARLIDLFSAKGTAVVTDVPGPRRTVRLGGVTIRDAYVWAPCAGSVGASVSIFSYRDTVRVGFLVHAGLTPPPRRTAQRFTAEVAALRRRALS